MFKVGDVVRSKNGSYLKVVPESRFLEDRGRVIPGASFYGVYCNSSGKKICNPMHGYLAVWCEDPSNYTPVRPRGDFLFAFKV